jgi:hypothetical protein
MQDPATISNWSWVVGSFALFSEHMPEGTSVEDSIVNLSTHNNCCTLLDIPEVIFCERK